MTFGLKNSGQRAFAPSDFQNQLTISFPKGKIVSAEIASQLPPNHGGQLLISESQIQLAPLLLNPNDQILIQVLLSATKPTWVVDVRILDISSLVPINSMPKLPPLFKSGAVFQMGALLLIGCLMLLFSKDKLLAYFLICVAVIIMPLLGFLIHFFYDFGNAAKRRITEV